MEKKTIKLYDEHVSLKRCPFCGAIAYVRKTSTGYGAGGVWTDIWEVGCFNCNATPGGHFESVMERDERGNLVIVEDGYMKAIKAWNRRWGESKDKTEVETSNG